MITAAIIVGIILLFLVFLTFYISKRNDGKFDGVTLGLIIVLLFYTEAFLIYCSDNKPNPTAMDVYQGKTTLEYKVVDGVKVDSVVIFKNEDYGKN